MKLNKTITSILFLLIFTCSFTVCKAQENAEKIYRYNVKGVIVALPSTEKLKTVLKIKHEAIPDYVDETGKAVGMNAMTMAFELKEGVTIGDLKVGDSVQFVLESWWKPKPGDQIVSIKKIE